jgi:hypothetical protein
MAGTGSKVVKLKSKMAGSLTEGTKGERMILRDFIHDRLYGEPGGYFTR